MVTARLSGRRRLPPQVAQRPVRMTSSNFRRSERAFSVR